MNNTFIVVIASFNEPYYKDMVNIRIDQLRKRNLPFHFLINGDMPSDIDLNTEEYTIEPILSVSVLSKFQVTPWATKAFQAFLQNFYSSDEAERYQYILRMNVSTFVSFERLHWMLQFLPKEKLICGPVFEHQMKIFCNGTAMIFSKDVAKAFAFETKLDDEFCRTQNDDLVISWTLMERFPLQDINFYFLWCERYTEVPNMNEFFGGIRPHHVFFRIKNEANREKVDSTLWRALYNVFG